MTLMERLLSAALAELETGRRAVMTAVVSSEGSTPRTAGALMLTGEEGFLAGTIGGGTLEHHCIQEAVKLEEGRLEKFILDNQKAGSLGMICGGNTEILFTPLKDPAPLKLALEILRKSAPGWLCLPLDGSDMFIQQEGDMPRLPEVIEADGKKVLAVRLVDAGRVFIFGGGHVALEVAALLDRLEFRYVVVDDREEFSSPERFPRAEQTYALPFNQVENGLTGSMKPNEEDGICVMTRGHEGDTDAVRFALHTPASYIGLMGSKRKREKVFAKLEEEGFSNARERIVTPIGIDIKAQTPAEIAVSVVAQLIQWRAERR